MSLLTLSPLPNPRSFFENIDRYIDDYFVPTEADVLRSRVRSTGIEEAQFVYDGLQFSFALFGPFDLVGWLMLVGSAPSVESGSIASTTSPPCCIAPL